MKLSLPVLLLIGASVCAQTVTNPFYRYEPLGPVKDFLQLSDGQLQTILANNGEYNQWASDKQSRISQVQTEIGQETARSTLDPNALGIRYAEIETICREMKDKANEYRTRNLDVLSQDQKTKLKILEDAVKLAPVISQAQTGNLIGNLTYAPLFFTGTSAYIGTTGGLLGGFIGPANGCYSPVPTAVVRTGDFMPTPAGGAVIPANRVAVPMPGNRVPAKWFDTTRFRPTESVNQK